MGNIVNRNGEAFVAEQEQNNFIDTMVDQFIEQYTSEWRDILVKRRLMVIVGLQKMGTHLWNIFQGSELPNVSEPAGKLLIKLLADAGLQVLIQARVELRHDELVARAAELQREKEKHADPPS
jgi:hypothetical protein